MEGFGANDVIGLLLDSSEGTLTVFKNGVRLGIAVQPFMKDINGKMMAGLVGRELQWVTSIVTTDSVELVMMRKLLTPEMERTAADQPCTKIE